MMGQERAVSGGGSGMRSVYGEGSEFERFQKAWWESWNKIVEKSGNTMVLEPAMAGPLRVVIG